MHLVSQNPLMSLVRYEGQDYYTSQHLHAKYQAEGLFSGSHLGLLEAMYGCNAFLLSVFYGFCLPIKDHSYDFERLVKCAGMFRGFGDGWVIPHWVNQGAERMFGLLYPNGIASDILYTEGEFALVDKDCASQILRHIVNKGRNIKFRDENSFYLLLKSAFGKMKIERQYPVGDYFIDFYFPESKLAVEYDEQQHRYTHAKDGIRQKNITEMLGCSFVFVKQKDEGYGLLKVQEALVLKNLNNQQKGA
jgi:very-short-patch-repair endonuclease